MTGVSWTIFLILAGVCWLFSMIAAFFLGQTAVVRAQMAHKAVIAHEIRNAWELLLLEWRAARESKKPKKKRRNKKK